MSAFKRHGINAKGLCWKNKKSQYLRFEKILEALPDDTNNISVVDLGCGFGDFYIFLEKKNICLKQYIGIEAIPLFSKIAKRRTNQTILNRDILKAPLPNADFYICSGTLNTFTQFETYLVLQRALLYANKGVIFNVLYGTKKSTTYNYISKKQIKDIVRSLKSVVYFQDEHYIQNDITIGIRKD